MINYFRYFMRRKRKIELMENVWFSIIFRFIPSVLPLRSWLSMAVVALTRLQRVEEPSEQASLAAAAASSSRVCTLRVYV